jgi:hypothetical protein
VSRQCAKGGSKRRDFSLRWPLPGGERTDQERVDVDVEGVTVEAGLKAPVVDAAFQQHAIVGVALAVGQLEVLAVDVVVRARAGVVAVLDDGNRPQERDLVDGVDVCDGLDLGAAGSRVDRPVLSIMLGDVRRHRSQVGHLRLGRRPRAVGHVDDGDHIAVGHRLEDVVHRWRGEPHRLVRGAGVVGLQEASASARRGCRRERARRRRAWRRRGSPAT